MQKATNEVAKINPMFTKVSTPLDLPFKNLLCCNFTKIKGGITMIGVALITLLAAVSPTAYQAACLDVPTSFPFYQTQLSPFSTLHFSSKIRSQYLLKQQLRMGLIYQESFSCLVLMTLI